jgi:small GTP-binding protein
METAQRRFKVVFLGDYGVGKSSIIRQRIGHGFDIRMPYTVGIDQYSDHVALAGEEIVLLLIDTAGQERFRSITPMYLRDCAVACLVASIVDDASIRGLVGYWSDFLSEAYSPPAIVIAVNKTDLAAELLPEQIDRTEQILREKFEFVQYVSALQNDNIGTLFEMIAHRALVHADTALAEQNAVEKGSNRCC